MKRCQNDNPYHQEIVNRGFFSLHMLGDDGKNENKIRKQKGKQREGRGFEERKW